LHNQPHCWLAVPQATKWQRIGNQIDAAFTFARLNLVTTFAAFNSNQRAFAACCSFGE
jgi:hypothetical protein